MHISCFWVMCPTFYTHAHSRMFMDCRGKRENLGKPYQIITISHDYDATAKPNMSVVSQEQRKHAALALIHLKLQTPLTCLLLWQKKKKKNPPPAAVVRHVWTAGFIYSRHVIPGALSNIRRRRRHQPAKALGSLGRAALNHRVCLKCKCAMTQCASLSKKTDSSSFPGRKCLCCDVR